MPNWYQIENSHFTIQVTSTGAEIKRLFAKPWNRDLLWIPQGETEEKIWKYSSPVLFPIVGKLKNDTYVFGGKNYQMPQHGFARNMNFKCTSCDTHEMEFLLESDQETFKMYPFCFELRIKYVLANDSLITHYSVKNTDRQDIYFSIGVHPAFETTKVDNYEIIFEKQEAGFVQLEKGLVDWNKINPLKESVLIPNQNLFLNDALIFKNLKSNYIDLVDQKRHEIIRVNCTGAPFLGIWGKDSVPFVCIEPWYGVSDSVDHDQKLESKNGIQSLPMGETFHFNYSIELTSNFSKA